MALTTIQNAMMGNSSNTAFNPGVPIIENSQNVRTNYTTTANTNALSAGPITIDTGYNVTISDGSNWVIV
jgi:hypothetical protein